MKTLVIILSVNLTSLVSFSQGTITVSNLNAILGDQNWAVGTGFNGLDVTGTIGFGSTSSNAVFTASSSTPSYIIYTGSAIINSGSLIRFYVDNQFTIGQIIQSANYEYSSTSQSLVYVPEPSANAFFFPTNDPSYIYRLSAQFFTPAVGWVVAAIAACLLLVWLIVVLRRRGTAADTTNERQAKKWAGREAYRASKRL